mmetsp:Transcript_19615/g.54907  ORF Transcript_19615/g.54907 Transcript_19615/m.54907 type:complete len:237 (-) Transcript_19615:50-760(-)
MPAVKKRELSISSTGDFDLCPSDAQVHRVPVELQPQRKRTELSPGRRAVRLLQDLGGESRGLLRQRRRGRLGVLHAQALAPQLQRELRGGGLRRRCPLRQHRVHRSLLPLLRLRRGRGGGRSRRQLFLLFPLGGKAPALEGERPNLRLEAVLAAQTLEQIPQLPQSSRRLELQHSRGNRRRAFGGDDRTRRPLGHIGLEVPQLHLRALGGLRLGAAARRLRQDVPRRRWAARRHGG